MPLQFEVFDAESGAFAYPDAIYDDLLAEIDRLLDDHQSGRIADKPYLAPLAIWHGTNMAEPETACEYIQMYLSTAIVTKRKDRRGQIVWPWSHTQY